MVVSVVVDTMAKIYKIVDPLQQPGTSGIQCLTTAWSKCALCQEDTSEMLRTPEDCSSGYDLGAGYKTTAANLIGSNQIGCLPATMKMSRLDEGKGIEATFRQHKAKWHDSCRLKFNRTSTEEKDPHRRRRCPQLQEVYPSKC